MAVGALSEEHGANTAACGSPRSDQEQQRDQDQDQLRDQDQNQLRDQDRQLDLRLLESLAVEEGEAYLNQILKKNLKPVSLYLPLDQAIIEAHPEEVKKVLNKFKGSLRVATVVQNSPTPRRSQGDESRAQLDVLEAVLQLPQLQRLRLFSPIDYGMRGAHYHPCFSKFITAGLTSLDLRCSATYFNLACRKLISIHRSTLKQVRLPERPTWLVVRELRRCHGLESLGLADFRLLQKLDMFLPMVRELLLTSLSTARRRRQGATRSIILQSSMMQQVTHISLEDRFCADLPTLAIVCQSLERLTLRGFSSMKLNSVKRALGQFHKLNHIRLFHCEVREGFSEGLRNLGIEVDEICNRASSPGVFMKPCNVEQCDSCEENIGDAAFDVRWKRERQILQKLSEDVDSEEKRAAIERATVKQAENSQWVQERKFRLTASNFAAVCRRRDTTFCHNLVRKIVYPCSLEHIPAVRWGRSHESEAKAKYTLSTGNKVKDCGVFIREDLPFLAASPDGLVGEEGLVEVKSYPFIPTTVKDAVQHPSTKLPVFWFNTAEGPTLRVKRYHQFHYQIQGQLAICRREWCDLVLHGPDDQVVVRVERDDAFWAEMVPKLQRFYMQCLLPEFADSRIRRGLPAREPQYVLKAIDEARRRRLRWRKERGSVPPQTYQPLFPMFSSQFANMVILNH